MKKLFAAVSRDRQSRCKEKWVFTRTTIGHFGSRDTFHVKMSEMLVKKFELNPKDTNLDVAQPANLTPKRYHFKMDMTAFFFIISSKNYPKRYLED